MLSNVILFTGEERFLLDKELLRRKEGFTQKFGSDAIFSFDFENLDVGMIKQAVYGGGLFVTKKMIVISGIPYEWLTRPSAEQQVQVEKFADELMAREWKIPEESMLVFVSSKPDKRLKLYKFLERNSMVKSFDQYKERELKDFVISQLPGIYIPNDVVEYFLFKVGADLYRLRFECEKLKTRCEVKNVKTVDQLLVDKIVFWQVETNAFALLDALFTNTKQAIQIIDKIQENGEDWNAFAGMLYRSLKLSLFIVDLVANWIKDSKEIAVVMSANPWQISKTLKQLKQLQDHNADMKVFYSKLVELDYGIKSGKYPDTYFWLGIKKMLKI
jgi:DNA polymerase III delta subunit